MVSSVIGAAFAPRKRMLLLLLVFVVCTTIIQLYSIADYSLAREVMLTNKLADMNNQLQFLKAMYRMRQEEILFLQGRLDSYACSGDKEKSINQEEPTLAPEVIQLLKNMSGMRASNSLHPETTDLRTSIVYQLLPHLVDSNRSLYPAFHMKGNQHFYDYVIGIPTVRRDKENYLMITLENLLGGLHEYGNSTLIVVYVGETELEYVLTIAKHIEAKFPRSVEIGMIEVISPSSGYYPDLNKEKPTLGDSARRFRWRTKQNLDAIFLLAYARTRGTYYLMLEDDIICKPNYMQEIKTYTALVSVTNPDWFYIEYCPIGGIGKLFKSSSLIQFITFVQIFYRNMPIDWLLERYLETRICSFSNSNKECKQEKLRIRPKYKTSLFQHIGLYSSLKGKIQKIKGNHFGNIPKFHPHSNPPLKYANTTISVHGNHRLVDAYMGKNFFWGITPKAGDYVEFALDTPAQIESYLFRSGNVDHVSDRFKDSVVEILPESKEIQQNFTQVGTFDEFGLAEGILSDKGNIEKIRIKVNKDHKTWVILSEIHLKESQIAYEINKTKHDSIIKRNDYPLYNLDCVIAVRKNLVKILVKYE